jgi:hypothetical protein
MKVDGEHYAPALLPPGKEPPIRIGPEAGCALHPVWTLWRNVFVPAGNHTPNLLTNNFVAVRKKSVATSCDSKRAYLRTINGLKMALIYAETCRQHEVSTGWSTWNHSLIKSVAYTWYMSMYQRITVKRDEACSRNNEWQFQYVLWALVYILRSVTYKMGPQYFQLSSLAIFQGAHQSANCIRHSVYHIFMII